MSMENDKNQILYGWDSGSYPETDNTSKDSWICTGLIEDCPKTYEEYYKRLSENKKRFKRKVDLEVRK